MKKIETSFHLDFRVSPSQILTHFHLTLKINDFLLLLFWLSKAAVWHATSAWNELWNRIYILIQVCVHAASCTSDWNYECLQFPTISTSLRRRSPARAKNEPSKNRSAPLPSQLLLLITCFLPFYPCTTSLIHSYHPTHCLFNPPTSVIFFSSTSLADTHVLTNNLKISSQFSLSAFLFPYISLTFFYFFYWLLFWRALHYVCLSG